MSVRFAGFCSGSSAATRPPPPLCCLSQTPFASFRPARSATLLVPPPNRSSFVEEDKEAGVPDRLGLADTPAVTTFSIAVEDGLPCVYAAGEKLPFPFPPRPAGEVALSVPSPRLQLKLTSATAVAEQHTRNERASERAN